MKKYLLMLASAAMVAALAFSCDKADQEEDVEIEPLKCELTATTDNWIFESKPEFTLMIENPNKKAVEANIHIWVATDKKEAVKDKENTIKISGNSIKKVNIKTNEDLEPGFYTITLKVDKQVVKKNAGFGISPFDIPSPPDMQPNFDSYWASVKAQLPDITDLANVTLTEIPSKSSSAQKVYLVEMKSVPDGLTGDPVTVRGY